jgi:transcriptional regulator with XRE-family HTH domain
MRVETAIGNQIARLREARQMSLTQLGEAIGSYLDKPWSRQAVHQAERGRRAFTAAELTALALALDTSVPALFLAEAQQIELPGATVSPEDYRAILLYAGSDAPLDGIDELLVALHDIEEILSRPTLARLAKIERVAEQIARANDGRLGLPGQPRSTIVQRRVPAVRPRTSAPGRRPRGARP